MMFHRGTKTAFVLPPKTGTTTLVFCLEKLNFRLLPQKKYIGDNRHPFPKEFLKTYPVLNEYKFYGFFRNPLDRFQSLLSMSGMLFKKIDHKNYEKSLIKNFNSIESLKRVPKNQVEWLDYPIIKVLDFDNFEKEVSQIGKAHGREDLEIPRLNASSRHTVATDEMKTFVREYYSADYQFAKRVLGKEYLT